MYIRIYVRRDEIVEGWYRRCAGRIFFIAVMGGEDAFCNLQETGNLNIERSMHEDSMYDRTCIFY